MEYLQFIIIALAVTLIYRQGLKDGQKVAAGEKIVDKPIKLFKSEKEKQNDRISEGMRARAEFRNEVIK